MMAKVETAARATGPVRQVEVWDPLVRLIHWGLALAILLNGALLDPDSEVHELVGYAALGLVVTRLLWGLIGPEHARFSAFPPSLRRALAHIADLLRGRKSVHLSHNPLGALMVYNIWGTVLAITATGIMMGNARYFANDWVEEAHEALFGWLVFSVALHLAGVVVDSLRTGVPLVRAMIDGRKRIPAGSEVE